MAGSAASKPVHIDGPEAFGAAFGVSRETLERLAAYAELLERWSAVKDLVAPSTLPDVWHRHFADSAQLLALVPAARRWADLGSGAGFPGLVLAIMATGTPGWRMTLIESNARKCAFLRDVARHCGSPVDILSTRIEAAASQLRSPGFDVVTARALAPLGKLLGLARPLLGREGVALFLKGREWAIEVAAAREHWRFQVRTFPSRTDPDGRVVEIAELASLRGDTP